MTSLTCSGQVLARRPRQRRQLGFLPPHSSFDRIRSEAMFFVRESVFCICNFFPVSKPCFFCVRNRFFLVSITSFLWPKPLFVSVHNPVFLHLYTAVMHIQRLALFISPHNLIADNATFSGADDRQVKLWRMNDTKAVRSNIHRPVYYNSKKDLCIYVCVCICPNPYIIIKKLD